MTRSPEKASPLPIIESPKYDRFDDDILLPSIQEFLNHFFKSKMPGTLKRLNKHELALVSSLLTRKQLKEINLK